MVCPFPTSYCYCYSIASHTYAPHQPTLPSRPPIASTGLRTTLRNREHKLGGTTTYPYYHYCYFSLAYRYYTSPFPSKSFTTFTLLRQ